MAGPVYDAEHRRERAEADAKLVAFGPIPCRRCQRLVYPDRLARRNWDHRKFDLGHPDPGQAGKAPEHATCNREAGGRRGRQVQLQPASEEWW